MKDLALLDALKIEAARIEEDALYSAKGHFNTASRLEKWHYKLGIPATIFSLCAMASIFKSHYCVAATFSLLTTIFSGLLTFLKLSEKSAIHKKAGNMYYALKNDARVFKEITLLQGENLILKDELHQLSKRRNDLNGTTPNIPEKDYKKARKGVEEGQNQYVVDRKD